MLSCLWDCAYKRTLAANLSCKTMERMINRRLVCYTECHNLLADVQCGFRSRRSMVDQLLRFETFYTEGFIHNQHLVFFDLEKAYDSK